jgi:TPR repeat protein
MDSRNGFIRPEFGASAAPSWPKPCLLGILVFFFGGASADYQAGLDAYESSDYATALAEWKAEVAGEPDPDPAALVVYREALYGIAMLYWKGEGVEQDYAVSSVWLKQAADINHPGAQTKLGYLFTTGQGVPQNYREAVRFFQMAARQGDPDAKHNLDVMYQQGLIPEPVDEKVAPKSLPGSDHGEDWILQQDPQRYTIQVIALSAPDKLMRFIARYPERSPFAIYRQAGYQRPIWVMVQGNYPDVDAARMAVQSFPEDLQSRGKLWIRKFDRVQRLIK